MKEIRQEFREGRREEFKEFKEGMGEAREQFKQEMKERKVWNAQNASGTASGTAPTPWKDFRENVKEARQEFRQKMQDEKGNFHEDVKEMRGQFKDMKAMMKPKMASLTDAQTSNIAGKLGITPEQLKAELASGTKLKELVKDKISPEEMRQILPPRVASVTRAIEERGFFNQLRSRLLGPRQEAVEQVQNEFGEVEEIAKPLPPQSFLRRLFNW